MDAHESARKRLESTPPKDHEDRIAEKGFNSIRHYNLVREFVPMSQAMKIQDAKSAVANNGRNSSKKVVLEAQREKKKVQFDTRIRTGTERTFSRTETR